MIDLNLLRLMKYREDYYRIRGRVPAGMLDKQTDALLADFGKYFDRQPDATRVDMQTFLPMFRAWHPNLTEENAAAYDAIFKNAAEDVPDGARDGILQTLLELRLATQLARLVDDYAAGDVASIQASISKQLDEFKADAGIIDISYITDDIGDLLREEHDNSGLLWRLSCLQGAMRGLRPGDFGIIAGRPDKGKTTFIASELTHLVRQLPDAQNALWLNNEGPGRRIIPRLYQAALGATMSELSILHNAGRLKPAYAKAVGRLDRIRIVDVHGMDNYTVERVIEANDAGIVVYDMIDHIRGFGDMSRTDLQLEEMYKWGRETSVKHNLVGLATSQISNDGDGMQFPTLGMLKDSKTGKQGACDFQLMIGASNDVGLAGARFLGLPKNKLRREGAAGDPRATVQFSPQRARFEDIPEALEDTDAKTTSD